MSERRGVGRASRGVMREIEQRLGELDSRLARYDELADERDRLRQARAALLAGKSAPAAGSRRISQDEVAAYLGDHPGSKASDIASDLGVVLQTVSSHLYRGRETRFENRPDGWHLRARRAGRDARRVAQELLWRQGGAPPPASGWAGRRRP